MSLAAEIAQGRTQQHVATHIYYRQPNGWITSGAAGQIERTKFMAEGWEPLSQYGRLDVLYEYINNHPLEPLFMRGGAIDLPVSQVIDSGFWMDPPVVPGCGIALNPEHIRHNAVCWETQWTVEFPQVPEDTPRSFDCHFCERRSPTEKARDQHEGVAHKDERANLRTGDALATSLVKGLKGAQAQITTSASPYVCGFCADGFNSPVALGKHVKAAHK